MGWRAEMARVLYRPIGLFVSVLGGLVAGAIFKRLWRVASDGSEAPKATDERRSWREVTGAAAVQGAVYGGVKALIDRAGATGLCSSHGLLAGTEQDVSERLASRRACQAPNCVPATTRLEHSRRLPAHGSRADTPPFADLSGAV